MLARESSIGIRARVIGAGVEPAVAREAPSIDLVAGYHKANNSPLLKTFLSRADDMISHVAQSCRKIEGALSERGGAAGRVLVIKR
jgi:hypothetical protein